MSTDFDVEAALRQERKEIAIKLRSEAREHERHSADLLANYDDGRPSQLRLDAGRSERWRQRLERLAEAGSAGAADIGLAHQHIGDHPDQRRDDNDHHPGEPRHRLAIGPDQRAADEEQLQADLEHEQEPRDRCCLHARPLARLSHRQWNDDAGKVDSRAAAVD